MVKSTETKKSILTGNRRVKTLDTESVSSPNKADKSLKSRKKDKKK
jgi:hypothetical protein